MSRMIIIDDEAKHKEEKAKKKGFFHKFFIEFERFICLKIAQRKSKRSSNLTTHVEIDDCGEIL